MAALRFYFLFYARLAHHRGLSHLPIIGTLTRLAYISPLLIIAAYFGVPFGPWFLWVLLGLMLSDTVHFIHDRIYSARKRRLR